jgi:4-hydroxy-tetrahydrodipicolinate reductase
MSIALAIVGHGKMGRLVEHLAATHGFQVRATFNSSNNSAASGLTSESLKGIDVAVEFSTPQAAPGNLVRLAELGVKTISGTTGWFDQLPAVRQAVSKHNSALVWGANFSVGVNLFLKTVAQAAALFANQPEYEAWGWEIHHSAKKDSLSGTLLKLADEMRASGYTRPIGLIANRAGAHPGTHEIGFDSASDTITLRHTARNRDSYALGALRAARWIIGKKGIFEFREILSQLD